jgi:hypothetical protein
VYHNLFSDLVDFKIAPFEEIFYNSIPNPMSFVAIVCFGDAHFRQINSFQLMLVEQNRYRPFKKLDSLVEIAYVEHFVDSLDDL